LYRARLHGRRALVLLDNAASEDQVRPLLPGGPTCLALITSRRGLPGLDGVNPLRLDVLAEVEAVDLLARVAGHDRVMAERATATRIVESCGHLPIAITVAGRLLRPDEPQHRHDEHGRIPPRPGPVP
jgi:NB-ARC domain-containing protein